MSSGSQKRQVADAFKVYLLPDQAAMIKAARATAGMRGESFVVSEIARDALLAAACRVLRSDSVLSGQPESGVQDRV